MPISHEAPRELRVVLADDHRILRQGLRQLLDGRDGLSVVGEAENGHAAVAIVRRQRPDVLVLDMQMPISSGLDALRALASGRDRVRTLILTGSADREKIASAIDLGARGVVDKTDAVECLIEAIRSVATGAYWAGRRRADDVDAFKREFRLHDHVRRDPFNLTDRQREIIAGVVSGLTNPQIAATLSISPETVKHHLTQIFHKTGVSTRLELALLARDYGIVSAVAASD